VNDILKQRLVGALILVALGVVFWPIIFVEPTEQVVSQPGRIPPRPEVDVTPIEPPDVAGLRPSPELALYRDDSQAPEPESEPEPEPEQAAASPAAAVPGPPADSHELVTQSTEPRLTRSEAPERPVIDSDGVPVAWILQVASVSSVTKAEELRDRLLAMQLKAYVKKVEHQEQDLYRVYIGPKFEKAKLDKVRAQVDAEFGVKSMITRYIP
jgi:DedD protein